MQTEWCYIKDKNGSLWLRRISPDLVYKSDLEWKTKVTIVEPWVKISPTTHKPIIAGAYSHFLTEFVDLSNIPEPNWEDEKPIVVLINLTSSINYYVE